MGEAPSPLSQSANTHLAGASHLPPNTGQMHPCLRRAPGQGALQEGPGRGLTLGRRVPRRGADSGDTAGQVFSPEFPLV